MPYRCLYIWVEGSYDDLFFSEVMRPLLESWYDWIEVVQYAEEEPAWRRSYLRKYPVKARRQLYLRDRPQRGSVCYSEKGGCARWNEQRVEADRMMVVVPEIEGWYLAGLDAECKRQARDR